MRCVGIRGLLALSLAVSLTVMVVGTALDSSASATTGTHPNTSHATPSGSLTLDNEQGKLWTCGFNPFNPALSDQSGGFLYEPLIYIDTLESGKTTPWLATSYSWSDGNKVLTFTIRKGVKWSDGKQLSASDVLYTFQLLKEYPALDLNAIWSVLSSVLQRGDQIVLTFKAPAVPDFYYVADQTFIVPQHIWSHVKNPVTYADSNPIGTGPYTVGSCTSENISYSANRNYWQPGLPKIATVNYPAFISNTAANTFLASGQTQWGSQFIPDIGSFYLSKSPANHFWSPPAVNLSLFINQKVYPLNDVAVRRAMAYALNRPRVSLIGESGLQPASNQTGVVLPTFSSWYDSSLAAKYGYGYYPSKAISILEKDGYKRGSNGIFAKNGKQLSFTVITQSGNTDWIADLEVAEAEWAAVGIKVTSDLLAGGDFVADVYQGDFQLAYSFYPVL